MGGPGSLGASMGPPSGDTLGIFSAPLLAITGPITSDQEIKSPFHEPPRNAVVLNENKLGVTPYLLFLKKRKRISSTRRPRASFEKAPS